MLIESWWKPILENLWFIELKVLNFKYLEKQKCRNWNFWKVYSLLAEIDLYNNSARRIIANDTTLVQPINQRFEAYVSKISHESRSQPSVQMRVHASVTLCVIGARICTCNPVFNRQWKLRRSFNGEANCVSRCNLMSVAITYGEIRCNSNDKFWHT